MHLENCQHNRFQANFELCCRISPEIIDRNMADFVQYGLPLSLVIFIVSFAVSFLVWLKAKLKIVKQVNELPGPKGKFIFGNLFDFMVPHDRLTDVFVELCKTFKEKPLFRIRLLHKFFVFILHTSAAEEFLINHKNLPKAKIYDLLKPWLGSGLLLSSGDQWQKHRKLLAHCFDFQILTDFLQSFNQHSETLVSILNEKANTGTTFNMYPYVTLCTLDIICSTTMGKEINAQRDTESKYVKAVTDIGEIFILRSARPWLHSEWIFNLTSLGKKNQECIRTLHSFTWQVIKERKESHLNGNYKIGPDDDDMVGKKKKLALLDTLLENGKLTDEEIREQVDTFMFAGHDTSSTTINFTIFNVGTFPEIQKRVHEELDEIFEGSDRQVTLEDLSQMKYLEAVIRETLRLYPPVSMFGKNTTADVKLAGYIIPAGTDVFIPVRMLHNNPTVFPNPDEFDPSRFLTDNCLTKRTLNQCYIPFSVGLRNCIGQKFAMMEVKVVLSFILRNFNVTTHEKISTMKFVVEPVLKPVEGIQVSLLRRGR